MHPGIHLVAAQPRQFLDNDRPDLPVLHVQEESLKIRTVETGSRVSVIHIELWVGKAVVDSVLPQNFLLV